LEHVFHVYYIGKYPPPAGKSGRCYLGGKSDERKRKDENEKVKERTQ
jgi:hypothetical protein